MPKSVIGLDCSTKSIAFARLVDGKPDTWGEIVLVGNTAFERIHDARRKVAALKLKADVVAIEGAIYVNNMKASINLAYVYGAVLGELMERNSKVYAVEPITWQSYIGNPNWGPKKRQELRDEFPGHRLSWYKNEIRKRRKQQTIDWVSDEYDVQLDSDNVADSFGLAHYVEKHYA